MTCPAPSPSPETPPPHGWTPERKVLFLDRLAIDGNARAACRAVGLSAEAAYRMRRRDPVFARAWAAAVVLGRENSIQVLADRAIEGIEEEIYYRGEVVGTRRRYDSRLLLAHLARLDAVARPEDVQVQSDAAHFDSLLLDIGAGRDLPLIPDREDFIESARCAAENATYDEFAAAEKLRAKDKQAGTAQNKQSKAEKMAAQDAAIVKSGEDAAIEAMHKWAGLAQLRDDTVDSICHSAKPARQQQPRLDPALAVLMRGQANRETPPAPTTPFRVPNSTPCTASTVSTSTIARVLSTGPHGYTMTPRSPLRQSC